MKTSEPSEIQALLVLLSMCREELEQPEPTKIREALIAGLKHLEAMYRRN
jgi:hypothetical protein